MKMVQVRRFEELPIDDLVVDRFQVRKSNLSEGLEELAASIEKWGLLQPIIVCPSERNPEKWEIIAGQRRFLATKKVLKRQTIMAGVLDETPAIEDGLALSASENVVRLDMTRKDLIDLCAALYKRYGTIRDVVEETKLPYPIVRRYIRYDGLPDQLKKKVDDKELNVDLAMKIQDASTRGRQFDERRAEELEKSLKKVDDTLQRKILILSKKHLDAPVEKIVVEAEKPEENLRLKLNLGPQVGRPLERYSEDESVSLEDAATDFIAGGLLKAGYVDEEE